MKKCHYLCNESNRKIKAMVRKVKFVFENDRDAIEAVVSLKFAADNASTIASYNPNVSYSVDVRRFLKELLEDDFSNEIPKGETFASAEIDWRDFSITFNAVDDGVGLTSIHKMIEYVLECLAEFNGYCLFNGKTYYTESAK